MISSFNIHQSKKIQAEAEHVGDTHWINLAFVADSGRMDITVFLDNPALADAYAAAINGVTVPVPEPAS